MKKIIVLILSLIIAIVCISCKTLPQETSSATPSDTSTVTSTYSELESSEETMSTVVSQEPTSSTSQEPVSSTPAPPPPPLSFQEDGSSSTAPPSTPTTASSTPATTNQLPTTVTTTLGTVPIGTTADETSPEEYARLVEEATKYGGVYSPYANVGTGISWDGVTPILYTYEDGSTGYEPREGAKYEVYPGLIGRVYLSICFCEECGKASGNGTNGTCCQWLMGDLDCPNCGEHVKVRTCHTCG